MQLNGIASHILYLKYQPRSEIYSISFIKKCHLKQHFTVNSNISVLCLEILGLFCYYWIVFYQMKKNNNNNNMVMALCVDHRTLKNPYWSITNLCPVFKYVHLQWELMGLGLNVTVSQTRWDGQIHCWFFVFLWDLLTIRKIYSEVDMVILKGGIHSEAFSFYIKWLRLVCIHRFKYCFVDGSDS